MAEMNEETINIEVQIDQGGEPIPGPAGPAGKSAYEIAADNGFTGSETEWLASLVGNQGPAGIDGAPGKSAYEIAVDKGFAGTEEAWLLSLKGEKGDDGSDGDDGAPGRDGANGLNGKSAYEIAQDNGFTGTPEEWIDSLKGADGAVPTVEVGAVTTAEPDTSASVESVATATGVRLDFTLPRGADGADGGAGGANLAQQTVLDAAAGQEVVLAVNDPLQKHLFSPPMVLKFVPGATQNVTAFTFSEGDAEDWEIEGEAAANDDQVIFDGAARLKVEYEYEYEEPQALGDGYISAVDIDFGRFKKIEARQ